MAESHDIPQSTKLSNDTKHRTGKTILFCVLACVWWIFDRMTKLAMDVHSVGSIISFNVLGLFNFQLVHNTGAAWGILSNSTAVLGCFSIVVSVAIVIWLFAYRKQKASWLEVISLALVCAGGLGNAFDRLVNGYVVDFIACNFIDFPVFNIADVGVTVGVVLFCIALFCESSHS